MEFRNFSYSKVCNAMLHHLGNQPPEMLRSVFSFVEIYVKHTFKQTHKFCVTCRNNIFDVC